MKFRLSVVVMALVLVACTEERQARLIPGQSHGMPLQGAPAVAQVFAGDVVAHPFMAAPGSAAMHADGASSDVHAFMSPLGNNTKVHSRSGSRIFGGMCA